MATSDVLIDLMRSSVSLFDSTEPNASTGPLWTVEDVADYLKLQPETIRCMARRGELPAIKIGKVWRFRQQAIHEMLSDT